MSPQTFFFWERRREGGGRRSSSSRIAEALSLRDADDCFLFRWFVLVEMLLDQVSQEFLAFWCTVFIVFDVL